jgi:hypothetical protein
MRSIFNPADLQELRRRLAAMTPQSDRRWGRMNPHQAVRHLNDWFKGLLGDRPIPGKDPGPGIKVLRFIAFSTPIPWLRGFPTAPMQDQEKSGTPPTEFAADLAELDALMVRFVETGGAGLLPHNRWGTMSRGMWGRYGYRHVNHHLRQFGL